MCIIHPSLFHCIIMSTPAQTLSELDGVLSNTKWHGPPSDMTHLHDPQHLDVFKHLGNSESVISQRIVDKAKALIESSSPKEFRICSVGCEDGSLDKVVLDELSKAYPSVKFHYTGIETDEQVCETAEDKLTETASNVQVEFAVKDYEELSKDDFVEGFDLMFMVNCTYYASSLEELLKGAVQLLKPSGELIIISSSRQSFEELITRFWSHQRKHDLYTSETVTATLSKLGIKHTVDKATVTFDLTDCFNDNFKSSSSLLILDHLVFTRYLTAYQILLLFDICLSVLARMTNGMHLDAFYGGCLCSLVGSKFICKETNIFPILHEIKTHTEDIHLEMLLKGACVNRVYPRESPLVV